jgi:flavin-dependent dehydrogenase
VYVGCAFHDRPRARERFERVIEWYRAELGLPSEPGERTARYLSRPRNKSHLWAGDGTVLLAGEAAGLASPSSGEGISFALLSGAAAGRTAGAGSAGEAYASTFASLSRKILVKTMKARVIHAPAARRWALRLPWCP